MVLDHRIDPKVPDRAPKCRQCFPVFSVSSFRCGPMRATRQKRSPSTEMFTPFGPRSALTATAPTRTTRTPSSGWIHASMQSPTLGGEYAGWSRGTLERASGLRVSIAKTATSCLPRMQCVNSARRKRKPRKHGNKTPATPSCSIRCSVLV